MKPGPRLVLSAACALLCSCGVVTSTTFIEYRGPDIVAGAGGTVRTVDGIEFWEAGSPNRRCRILGVIDDSRSDKPLWRMMKDDAIAKVAKEHGGDAVVLIDTTRTLQGMTATTSMSGDVATTTGQANYRAGTRLAVVRYLP